MDELLRLCQAQKLNGSKHRKAIADPEAERATYKTKGGHKVTFLKKTLPTQTLRSGPIFDAAKAHLPETEAVQLNRNLRCFPHRDSNNAGQSHLIFGGDFEGGALVTEHGDRYEERGK